MIDRSTLGRPKPVHENGKGNGNGASLAQPNAKPAEPPAEPIDTRVLRGRAEFESVFGDLAKGKRNWQLACFGLLGVLAVLATGFVALATQSRITPYVVEVDRLGRAQSFGPAERLTATDQRVVTSQLAGFVRDIRSVLGEPAAQADLVRHAYAFADQGAATFLNAYFVAPANDPRLLGREITRLVEITSVLPIPGAAGREAAVPTTWKVSWTETTLAKGVGGVATTAAWEGYFGTRVVPPSTTERITTNPLGLYVTSINWTELARARSTAAESGTSVQATDISTGGNP